MNVSFAEAINPFLSDGDFAGALELAEGNLRRIDTTDFHAIAGESLLHHVNSLVDWVDRFFERMEKRMAVKALYIEMNEFDINTGMWIIEGCAYDRDGGLEDHEWFSDVTRDTITRESFIIRGYEKLQQAFEQVALTTPALQDARDWCEQIIITRFLELMYAAHREARRRKLRWADLPLYGTEHAYDFIVRSGV